MGQQASAAIILQAYSAKNHDRFYTGADRDFIGDAYDSTGVGRGATTSRWATMISDTYFLSANHYHPSIGASLRFYHSNDPAGGYEDVTVASGMQIAGSDLWLGRLSSAPTTNVQRYPILSYATTAAYNNIELFTYGLGATSGPTSQRLGRNNFDPGSVDAYTVGSTTGQAYLFDFDNPGGVGADESHVQGGDSGGPTFGLFDGEFALVGIHWFRFYTEPPDPFVEGSGDTFVPAYIEALNTEMMAHGESLTLTAVPEASPAIVLFALLVFGLYTSRYKEPAERVQKNRWWQVDNSPIQSMQKELAS